jgi:putative molybdopterin biosynthesis protein
MEKNLTLNQMKTLGHPRRLAILRRLMSAPATLSQLGEQLGESPAHVRHHLKALEEAGLVEPDPDHPARNHLEKYYRAASAALLINLAVLPESPEDRPAFVLGSKDRGAQALARHFELVRPGASLQVVPFNSLDGLVALRQGVCQMATCHLLDEASGEYNRPFVRHLFPGQAMAVVRLYRREQGLIVRPGNPLHIHSLDDLLRPEVRFINRELGSGIRLWLDMRLKSLGISPVNIQGYADEVHTHPQVAQAVLQGRAQAGIGLAACAREAGLDFVPLFDEPYELVLPLPLLSDPRCAPFFDHLNSAEFRLSMRQLDGYTLLPTAGQADIVE